MVEENDPESSIDFVICTVTVSFTSLDPSVWSHSSMIEHIVQGLPDSNPGGIWQFSIGFTFPILHFIL